MPGPRAAERSGARALGLALALVLVLALVLAACAGVPQHAARLAPSSYGCMQAVVARLPPRLPDKRAHCRAAGMIARYCSVPEAYIAGAGKEVRDAFTGGDAEWADWRADRVGIRCAQRSADDAELFACCAGRGY
jgi:hypothetical protein